MRDPNRSDTQDRGNVIARLEEHARRIAETSERRHRTHTTDRGRPVSGPHSYTTGGGFGWARVLR